MALFSGKLLIRALYSAGPGRVPTCSIGRGGRAPRTEGEAGGAPLRGFR